MTALNVADYGAVGDGTTDDTAAIQSAIDDATAGDTVFFPKTSDSYLVEGAFCIEINGNSHPDDLTLAGESEDSLIRYGGGNGGSNINIIRIDPRDGIEGLTIEKLRIDGNRSAVDGNPNVASGIQVTSPDSGAEGSLDILIENVIVEDTYGNGIDTLAAGTTVNRCTARDIRQHGFGADTFGGPHIYDPAIEFTNCLAIRCSQGANGFYGFDASGGNVDVVDCVAKDGGTHGVKFTRESLETNFVRVRCSNNDQFGFYRPPTETRTGSRQQTTYQDCIAENNGANSIRLTVDTDYTIRGEFVATQNGSDTRTDFWARNDASLDASDATIYINNSEARSSFLDWSSSGSGDIETLSRANNEGELSGSSNLSVQTRNGEEKADIDSVPTAEEVGAWTENEPEDEDRGEETETKDDDDSGEDNQFDGWTPKWDSELDDWSVVTGSEFEGEHALKFDHDDGKRGRFAIAWDRVGEPSDVEVLDRFRVPEVPDPDDLGFQARVYLRAATTDDGHQGYWIEFEDRTDSYRLAKYTNGRLIELGHFGTLRENTFLYRRFRAEGDKIKAKIWPSGENEPAGWDIEVTDADHSEGWIGFGAWGEGPSEYDVVSVGTGGESAPLKTVSPSISVVSPVDGDTISGATTVEIDVTNADGYDDSLSVEYRVVDDGWSTAEYDESVGYYTDTLDSTTVADGEQTLEARAVHTTGNVAETSIDVTVENSGDVETTRAEEISTSSAKLVGSLTSLGTSDEAVVYFEWRGNGENTWESTGEKTLEQTGEFSTEISDLGGESQYEFRAVAQLDEESAGEIQTFETDTADDEQSSDGPTIERFDITDRSDSTWTRFDVDWAVVDETGELDTAVTKLRSRGTTVAAESTSLTGDVASYTHIVRVRGTVDEVRMVVSDTANETATRTKQV